MSNTERLEQEHPDHEPYIYDQKCMSCRFFWIEQDEEGNSRGVCHKRSLRAYQDKPNEHWCWMWEDKHRPVYGHHPDRMADPAMEIYSSEDDYSEEAMA